MILTLQEFLRQERDNFSSLVVTSGGFDPLHIGHIRCIQAARILGDGLVVLVNDDDFLFRKKGYKVMSLQDRMEIVDALRGVDYTIAWHSDEQTVIGALEQLRPAVFAKGGDRCNRESIPEWDICEQIHCLVALGVGGGKIRSSSDIVPKEFNLA